VTGNRVVVASRALQPRHRHPSRHENTWFSN
jgi:hypothetical protein